jgi:hypothetical protein
MLDTPNATLIFGTEPTIQPDTTRSQKEENIISSRGNTQTQVVFKCLALLKQVGAADLHKVPLSPSTSSGGAVHAAFLDQALPDWVKPGTPVSVDYGNGDGFAGQVHFRRGRTQFAKQYQLGPTFFVSEISS